MGNTKKADSSNVGQRFQSDSRAISGFKMEWRLQNEDHETKNGKSESAWKTKNGLPSNEIDMILMTIMNFGPSMKLPILFLGARI